MTLTPHEFIRRFLMHVLPSGFHRIRRCSLKSLTIIWIIKFDPRIDPKRRGAFPRRGAADAGEAGARSRAVGAARRVDPRKPPPRPPAGISAVGQEPPLALQKDRSTHASAVSGGLARVRRAGRTKMIATH
jgi:hypothetical protein